jgi:hypothetical protein
MAGYSRTPLHRKPGIKPGFRIRTRNVPREYPESLAPLPPDVIISRAIRSGIDLWHLFTASQAERARTLAIARRQIRPAGMIRLSWPKKFVRGTIRSYRGFDSVGRPAPRPC